MISPELLITFFSASVLLALAPGPDNIFVLTQSILYGRKAGLLVMLGLCTGLVVHSTAVALGIAVIFKTSEIAFSVLKILGSGYLIYLAWLAFRSSSSKIQLKTDGDIKFWKLYGRGIIMNITNPKVSLFFLAFLPQFTDPSKGHVTLQVLLLGGFFIIATVLVFGSIALMASTIGKWLNRSERIQKTLNILTGVIFLGLAFKLASSKL